MTSTPKSRKTGRVKFFNPAKGYGFIIPDDQAGLPNNEEVFVHHTAIYNNGGFKSLSEGQEVEFDVIQGPKGMQATKVSGPGGIPIQGDPYANYMRNSGYDSHANRFGYGYTNTTGAVPPLAFGYPIHGIIPYSNVQAYAPYSSHHFYTSQPSSPSQQHCQPIMMIPQQHMMAMTGYQGYAGSPQYPLPASSSASSNNIPEGCDDSTRV